jgi:hypothetical protein
LSQLLCGEANHSFSGFLSKLQETSAGLRRGIKREECFASISATRKSGSWGVFGKFVLCDLDREISGKYVLNEVYKNVGVCNSSNFFLKILHVEAIY